MSFLNIYPFSRKGYIYHCVDDYLVMSSKLLIHFQNRKEIKLFESNSLFSDIMMSIQNSELEGENYKISSRITFCRLSHAFLHITRNRSWPIFQEFSNVFLAVIGRKYVKIFVIMVIPPIILNGHHLCRNVE